jgi:predicted ATPase/class 3 adenylate cyclase
LRPRVKSTLPSGSVTFLFTDIEGSTRLAQMLGDDYRGVLVEHRKLIVNAIASFGGVPLFTEGDSVFGAFPCARDALLACLAAQRSLAGHVWLSADVQVLVRMGLHTGYAIPLAGEYASPEVHRASRIATAAHGGQVICSEATMLAAGELDDGAWMLDLGLHRLRGFDDRERLFQLAAPGMERRFPRLRALATSQHNLPGSATSFIGRTAERPALAGLVGTNRLVNVVGPGGAGKTRLALEVAGDLIHDYPDGVWFTDLASVTDPGLVAVAVAAALGLRPEPGRAVVDTLREFVADKRCLLLLDTCDAQPAATATLVGRVLGSGSATKILATSREPLNLPGEVVWRIPSMSVDDEADGVPSEAVALLLDRIEASRGGRPVVATEIEQLSRVARYLDGLPLALELAAARLRMLSTTELIDRLDVAVDALDIGLPTLGADTPEGRHSTIQATVSWSYRTLSPAAAQLLKWLAVFAGRVDVPAVTWLTGADPFAELAVLVDKSLVAAEPTGDTTTYRMLDPIRAYLARRLADEGEDTVVHERHVAWARHEIERVRHGIDGRPVTLSMYALDPLADEVRAALKWSVSRGSARDGLRLARGLDQWWRERGLAREGRLWMFRLYERVAATGETVPDADLAAAYHMHAMHAGADGEHAEALRFSQRAEAAARRSGDNGLIARVGAGRAAPLLDMGDPIAAEKACRDILAWADEHDVADQALDAVYCLAQLLWRRGAADEAADLLGMTRPVEAARPSQRGRRTVDMVLGMVALSRGDLVAAHEHLVAALRSRMAFGFHSGACESLNALAARCALGGDQTTAARLFGAAQAAQVRLRGANVLFAPFWTEQQSRIREALGDRVFDEVYADGAALTLDEAVTVALSVDHPDMAVGSARFAEVATAPKPMVAPPPPPAHQPLRAPLTQ